jgi:hypothetical protein
MFFWGGEEEEEEKRENEGRGRMRGLLAERKGNRGGRFGRRRVFQQSFF